MWTTEYILSQVCVLIAISIFITTTFLRKRKVVLFLNCFVNVFYAIQYLLLQTYTGVVLNVIGIARGIWFYFDSKSERKNYISLISCNIAVIASSIITFSSWWDIIAIVSSMIFTFGVWQPNLQLYRILSIVNNVCFIAYNLHCKSYISVCFECVIIVLTSVSFIKFHLESKRNKLKEQQENNTDFQINNKNINDKIINKK